MRPKTCFSVVEMRSENVAVVFKMGSENMAFVSENEGSDLGIPSPNGPPSSDCPVVWQADGPQSSDCPQKLFSPLKARPWSFRSLKTPIFH